MSNLVAVRVREKYKQKISKKIELNLKAMKNSEIEGSFTCTFERCVEILIAEKIRLNNIFCYLHNSDISAALWLSVFTFKFPD